MIACICPRDGNIMRVCEAEMYANYLDDLERKED